ncbi:MAG: fasciclin domain-containing protein [Chloroflexi bacterium]|nr:fasciclin domain-containing protein [Chloroflexota bacterium]
MRRITFALLAGALAVGVVAAPAAAKQPDPGANIVKTAIAVNSSGPYAGQFDTLIDLVVKLDLAGPLSQRGQLTVFAPTDGAFAAIGITPATVDQAIATLGRSTLTDIVLYHVARGSRDASEVLGSSKIRMLNGDFAKVNASAGTIDGAPIIVTNVYASNGIIHAVGAVLLP